MKKLFFCVVVTIFHIFCLFSVTAEDQRILAIQRIYNEIRERETLEAGGEVVGGNTHSVTYKNIMPGTGYQNRIVAFFHDDDQDQHPGDIKQHLRKVTVDYNISAVRFHAEYLFSREGELLFHYMKDEGFTGGERRFYFYKGRLIRVKINPMTESDGGPFARYEASQSFSKTALELAEDIEEKAISHRKFFRLLLQFQHIE